jgi:predicted Zn-dependent peptidase
MKEKKLDNGLTIKMTPMKQSDIICVGFFVKVGARNETDEKNGISHFLEHMMFQGTTNRPGIELVKQLSHYGIQYNAVTTQTYTYYYFYGDPSNHKKILDIVLDIYLNTDFSLKQLENEKKVILEELRLRYDAPISKLNRLIHQKFFYNTTLARNIIGNEETLSNITKEDIMEYKRLYYQPKNTVFVVTGNFQTKIIYKLLSSSLNQLPNIHPVLKSYQHEKSILLQRLSEQKELYIESHKNNSLGMAYIAIVFPMFHHYKECNLDILSNTLSSGLNSRLVIALRQNNGISYNIESYALIYSGLGLFVIQTAVKSIEIKRSIKLILNELTKLTKEKISKEEIISATKTLKNESLYENSDPIKVLLQTGSGPIDDINEFAKKVFMESKTNIFIYGKIDEK